ncbi:hypothetical protein EON65_38375, partial [archaeon]
PPPPLTTIMPSPSSSLPFSNSPLNLQPGYFTQQTVSEECVWKCQLYSGVEMGQGECRAGGEGEGKGLLKTTTGTPLVSYNLDEKDHEEVQRLLQDLSEGDLVWSQVASTPPPAHPPPQPQPLLHNAVAIPRPPPPIPIMEKDSVCELEFDSHALHIENIHMNKAEFGAELWAEEKARFARLGIKMEEPAEMPYSRTMNRMLQKKEKEYFDRLGSLMEKGKALRKNAKDVLKSQQQISKTVPAEVLSQFLTAHDQNEIQDSIVDGKGSMDNIDSLGSMFDEWARDTIQFTANEAVMQDNIVKELMSQHESEIADSLVEEYVKSQRVSQQEGNKHLSSAGDYANKDEEEDEQSLDMIDKEAQDILSSTQLEEHQPGIFNPAEQLTKLSSIAENSPIIVIPSAAMGAEDKQIDINKCTTVASPMNLDRELEDNGWLYSTPLSLPSVLPDKLLSKAIRFDVLRKVDTSYIAKKERTTDNSTLDFSYGSKPPLHPSRRHDKSESGGISLVSALGGKRSHNSLDNDTPPHGTGILRTESRIAQKIRRTVSFAPSKDDNISKSSDLPQSAGSDDASITSTMDHYENSGTTSEKQQGPSLIPMFSDPTGRIRVSSIPISLQPSRPKTKGMTAKSMRLIPSFIPPCGSNLTPIELCGLPLVLNTPSHFSIKDDAIKEKRSLQAASGYASYQNQSSRNVVYKGDLPEFDGGVFSEEIGHFVPSSHTLPNRTRCLIPTFMPPKLPSASAQSFFASKPISVSHPVTEDKVKQNLNVDVIGGFTPSSWLKSQIATPTQTPGSSLDSQHCKRHEVGRASYTDHSDHMNRLIVLSMELFCCTRKDLLPNPKFDPVQCVVWIADDMLRNASSEQLNRFGGVICVVNDSSILSVAEIEMHKHNLHVNLRTANLPADTLIDIVQTEVSLFEKFIHLVKDIDPDFLVGYENLTHAYGYFIKRGMVLGIHCVEQLSRVPKEPPSFRSTIITGSVATLDEDSSALDAGDVGIYIKGRTFLNNWQLMTAEVKLADASIQHVVEVVLKKTLPFYSHKQQTSWFSSALKKHYMISYVYSLALANLLLLEKLDLFRKMSECARLYGIDFYSVIHRGSQYRVEAALLARAHSQGYLLLSPSRQKVANQAPMEVIPLVLEPKSQFYTDPVVVLDFQSLYPSIMIACNICFSTIIGKLRPGASSNTEVGSVYEPDTTSKLGTVYFPESLSAACATLHMESSELNKQSYPRNVLPIRKIDDKLAISVAEHGEGLDGEMYKVFYGNNTPYMSPNGSVFVSPAVRKGILPMMLQEMLDTRVMVKTAMKRYANREDSKHYRVLEKVLDARQLAIKLLSNVTYGYTAAGFSGRMPMAELADAIVQTGRSLLEHTIQTINSHPKWNARVVYGDTDSVFVLLPGRSLSQAFAIGEEISSYVTSNTPKHIILKFEKVYYPSILVTKKRYVGQCYENKKNLNEHHLDAKGIEMIR